MPKELDLPIEEHRQNSSGEMENVYKSKEYSKAENSRILDQLHKRKRRHKQKEFDVSDCLRTDLNGFELSRNNLSSEIFDAGSKQKRKMFKLFTAENSHAIANVESNRLSYNAVYHEGAEEGIVKNLEGQNNSKLCKKNKHSETKAENRQKEKHKNFNNPNELVHENFEPAVTVKLDNYQGKKRKHRVTEEENVSECRIAELGNDSYIKFLKGLKRQKKKGSQFKLLGEMENVFNHQKSAIDETGKNKTADVLEIHKREDKHKLNEEVVKESDCKISKSNDSEMNQNGSSSKNVDLFHKKKKHRHQLVVEIENTSNCETAYSNLIETDQNNLNSKNFNIFPQKKKRKHKQKLLDEMGDISDFKTEDSNGIEIRNHLNYDDIDIFHEKKKKKHRHKLPDEIENASNCETAYSSLNEIDKNNLSSSKNVDKFPPKKMKKHKQKLLDEMGDISDFKTEDSNGIEINWTDFNSEDNIHVKKKKKHKHKLLDDTENMSEHILFSQIKKACNDNTQEAENMSDCIAIDSNLNEINHNHLNKFNKKKRKHMLFSEIKNACNNNTQETKIDETEKNTIFDTLHVQKGNKSKSSDLDKVSNEKSINSNSIEVNNNELKIETFNPHHKIKIKKHRRNSSEVDISKSVTESNNTSSNIYHDHTKEKSMQNSVPDVSTKTNRKNKDHVEKRNEMDNLQEKEKNLSCKEPAKNYQEVAYTSFDPFICDMSDVPVSFPVPLLHENESVRSITPEKRVYLEENGVTIQTGKWTKTEDDILSRNFHQFGLQFGVNNPFQLLGINQNQRDIQLEKFKRAKQFSIRLGKDLDNRSLRSIYMRARKLLTPLKKKERLTIEEADDLKHAHQLVGNKWTKISEMLSRSDSFCQNALRWHKKDINKGKWTPEEKNNLIKAIKIVSGAEDLSANNVKKISWKAVANYVPTRNEFQCHKQWAEHLAWDTSVTEKGCWEMHHYGKLIYLLNEKCTFNSEYEIDWKELHKHFIDVTPSYMFLHKKWLYMKGKLPKGLDLSFKKCLDFLKRRYEREYQIFADKTL